VSPWSRVLLEKLIVTQLVKKFPNFYGIQRFITYSQGPATCPVLIQTNPAHTFPPYFPKIHSNIIFPSTPWSSKLSLPLRFSNKNVVCIYDLYHQFYMPHLSHRTLFDHPNNIWWSLQVTKPHICSLLQPQVISSLIWAPVTKTWRVL
jgi:hypothetical protein